MYKIKNTVEFQLFVNLYRYVKLRKIIDFIGFVICQILLSKYNWAFQNKITF